MSIHFSPTDMPVTFNGLNCKHIVGFYILNIQVNITLESMPEDLVDGKSTYV